MGSRQFKGRPLLGIVIISLVCTASGMLGSILYLQFMSPSEPVSALAAVSWLWNPDARQHTAKDFSLLKETITILEEQFVGEIPGDDVLNQAAIEGIVAELGDRYTLLLRPAQAALEASRTSGQFGGIGSTVEWNEAHMAVRITEPFPDSPAAKAGLQVGDFIVSVDGTSVSSLGMTGTIGKVRGPVDTAVVLGVRRGTEEFELTVVRAIIEMPTATHALIGPNLETGYLRLHTFNALAPQKIDDAIAEFQKDDITGMILDLRGNGGGLLYEAVEVAGLLAGNGLVVQQRYRDGNQVDHSANSKPSLNRDTPLVILVDRSSASASELLAGALQDKGRAVLIGESTLGKGSVQVNHELDDLSVLRVTNSRWFTPKGRSIAGQGLDPDIPVDRDRALQSADARDADMATEDEVESDPFIEAAFLHFSELRLTG